MTIHSEATKRVFERALERLKSSLSERELAVLQALLGAGSFGDVDRIEAALEQPRERRDA